VDMTDYDLLKSGGRYGDAIIESDIFQNLNDKICVVVGSHPIKALWEERTQRVA